jgi:hypothetical protein
MQAMANRRRKTLVVCATCHAKIHHEQPTTITTWSLENPVIGNGHAGCARDMTSSSGVRVPCGG